jgi:hypothetical protein
MVPGLQEFNAIVEDFIAQHRFHQIQDTERRLPIGIHPIP